MSDIQTQVKINKVNNGRYNVSLDCDIPALGKKEFKFIEWRNDGPAPQVGALLLATLHPTRRSKYWRDEGKFDDSAIEEVMGTPDEKPWMLDWQMLEAKPLPVEQPQTGNDSHVHMKTDSPAVPGGAPTVFVDGNLRYRVSEEMVNDREAIRMVLTQGQTSDVNVYGHMEAVLEEAEKVAAWLNTRLAARLTGGTLVEMAQQSGAVITSIEKEEDIPEEVSGSSGIPEIKNKAELNEWVSQRIALGGKWSRDSILDVLKKSGYEDSKAFLAKPGNTAQQLAEILSSGLDGLTKEQPEEKQEEIQW